MDAPRLGEEGFVRKKSACCVLAVNTEGTKDLLGIYLVETEGTLVLASGYSNRSEKSRLSGYFDHFDLRLDEDSPMPYA